jgi:CelD/BcsL family acetyltransferase involved in cellulose biosynthesis
MQIQWVTKFRDFLPLEEEWNALLTKSSFDILFLRHEWFRIWWEAYGTGAQLRILIIRENGETIGIAPLMLERERLRHVPVRVLKFMSNAVTPRSFFILHKDYPKALEAIMEGIYERSREWDILMLTDVPTDIGDYDKLLRILPRTYIRYYINQSRLSPYLKMSCDFDKYFAGLSANARSHARKVWKRANSKGKVVIKKMTKHSEIINSLDTAFDISSRSWKGDIGTDMGNTEESRRFYKQLSDVGSKKGWIILWILYLDDAPVAMQFHVIYGGYAFLFRSDFDEKFRDLSPGTVLDFEVLKDYFNSDLVEYDLCGTNYPYKMRLTNLIRPHKYVYIFNDRTYSRLLFFVKGNFLPRVKALRSKIIRQP